VKFLPALLKLVSFGRQLASGLSKLVQLLGLLAPQLSKPSLGLFLDDGSLLDCSYSDIGACYCFDVADCLSRMDLVDQKLREIAEVSVLPLSRLHRLKKVEFRKSDKRLSFVLVDLEVLVEIQF
jgi:hypothetical protein